MSDKHSKAEKSKQKTKINWLIPAATLGMFVLILAAALLLRRPNQPGQNSTQPIPSAILEANTIKLPEASYRSSVSVETTLKNVRPKRSYSDEALTLKEASQLLWAAQGVNVDWGDRTTPSAKSTYPLSVYLIVNNIEGLKPGLYQYIPGDREPIHALKPLTEGNYQSALYNSLNQNSMKNPAGVILITGNMTKMATAYGGVSHDKEVYLEAGHAAQNLYLQAESLKLGLVALSNFDDSIIRN
ncbi:hypothetical protein A2572_04610, partial [Candidatus Collierbacteria bacterium RIFOXYD1_FULL_40_9]